MLNSAPALAAGPETKAATDFVARHPAMICPYGRLAHKQGKVEMVSLPGPLLASGGSPLRAKDGYLPALQNEERVQTTIQQALRALPRGKQAVLLLENSPPQDHEEGRCRAWSLYAEILTACRVLNGDRTNTTMMRMAAVARACHFLNPATSSEYPTSGLPELGGDRLMLTVMNPLYPTTPTVHPRWCPVSCYLITPASELRAAQASNPSIALRMSLELMERTEIPYLGTLPYVLPNDVRFAPSDYPPMVSLVKHVQGFARGLLRGTPESLARETLMHVKRRILATFDADGKAALLAQQEATFDALQVWQEMGALQRPATAAEIVRIRTGT